ncbi:MAG: isoamylase early set domain-containing protein [Flavobacterium sp.]
MAIKKQFMKTKPFCKVTFSIAAKDAESATVIGDFNNWNSQEGMLVKLKNGTFKGAFDLPNDHTFEFKYLIDGCYINDTEADGLQWNNFAGAENSLLQLHP